MKKTMLMGAAVSLVLATSAIPALASERELNTAALDKAVLIKDGENAAGQLALVASPNDKWQGADGDKVTGRPVAADAHFRIGSVSKVFEAVVVLQLAAEHRIDLGEPVQTSLPGVLPDTFAPITVRQLLNHTSGLPSVDEGAPDASADEMIRGRFGYHSFEQIVQTTLRPKNRPAPGPHFAPGTKQEYNSFGYRVAGLLIERVTGHSFAEEVRTRIAKPLGLTGTSVPGPNPFLPRPYLHGYLTDNAGKVIDVSVANGDASSMISTPSDLDKMMVALFRGDLLPPDQQAELFALPRDANGALLCVPQAGTQCLSSGLATALLPDGSLMWGKTGHDLGYASGVFATPDLRRRAVYTTALLALDDGKAPALAARLGVAAFTPPAAG
ncbi:serine hydrolase domain-containing protein [Amycolatopsis sp. NPDC059657]|uniref:serine hydrolase domain-containing protein n=1 Tax=Amycolatopsis sp. NPDC059657 TaxID=3346899 RepID=UPI00366D8E04